MKRGVGGGGYLCNQDRGMTLMQHHNDLAVQFLGRSR